MSNGRWTVPSASRIPDLPDDAGSLTKPEQFVIVDDNTGGWISPERIASRSLDLAVIVPCVVNSETGEEERFRERTLGPQ